MGAGLRFHGLARDARLHPDEALYNTFARDAAVYGDWLFARPLDKPPLMLYANALSMAAVGVTVNADGVLDISNVRAGEFAGRLPNTLASILLMAMVYALTKHLYGDSAVALIAMLLLALSPFAIVFSATAFMDVFMVFWMVAALWMVTCDRWAAAGLCLALGFASKQPAPLYLPLILSVGLVVKRNGFNAKAQRRKEDSTQRHGESETQRERNENSGRFGMGEGLRPSPTGQNGIFESSRPFFREMLPRLGRFAGMFALGVALLLVWDVARGQPTIWQVSAGRENYPTHLIDLEQIIPRLGIWLGYARWMIGPGWLTAGLVLLAVAACTARLARIRFQRAVVLDGLLLVYVLSYVLLHWLVAFNTFDRYLLPVVPLVIVLAARGLTWLRAFFVENVGKSEKPRVFAFGGILAAGVLMGVLVITAADASNGQIDIGGDHGKHAGIDQLADYLNDKPVATIIYDRWLGWELEYYMGPWSDKRRVYYPTPDLLVSDALALYEIGPRYFPVPVDAPVDSWLDALTDAGFSPTPVYFSANFTVYRLIPPGISDA